MGKMGFGVETKDVMVVSKKANPKGEIVLVSPFRRDVALLAQYLSEERLSDAAYQGFLAGKEVKLNVTVQESKNITRVIYHCDGAYFFGESVSRETFTEASGLDFLPGKLRAYFWGSYERIRNFLEDGDNDDWVVYQNALWKVWKDLYGVDGKTPEAYDILIKAHYLSLGQPVPGGEGTVKVEPSSSTSAAQDPGDTMVHIDQDGNYTMGDMFLCKCTEIFKVLSALYEDGGTEDAADDRLERLFGAFKRLFKSAIRAKSGKTQNASDRDFLELIFRLMKLDEGRSSKALKVLYPPKDKEGEENEPKPQPQQSQKKQSQSAQSDSEASQTNQVAQPQPQTKAKAKGFSTPVEIDEGRKVALTTIKTVIGKIDGVIDGRLKSTLPLTDDLIGKLCRAKMSLKGAIEEAGKHKDKEGEPLKYVGATYLNDLVTYLNDKPKDEDNFAFIDDDGEIYGVKFEE